MTTALPLNQRPAWVALSEHFEDACLTELRELFWIDTLRTFLGFSENAALDHGVTPQQYQALLATEGVVSIPLLGHPGGGGGVLCQGLCFGGGGGRREGGGGGGGYGRDRY